MLEFTYNKPRYHVNERVARGDCYLYDNMGREDTSRYTLSIPLPARMWSKLFMIWKLYDTANKVSMLDIQELQIRLPKLGFNLAYFVTCPALSWLAFLASPELNHICLTKSSLDLRTTITNFACNQRANFQSAASKEPSISPAPSTCFQTFWSAATIGTRKPRILLSHGFTRPQSRVATLPQPWLSSTTTTTTTMTSTTALPKWATSQVRRLTSKAKLARGEAEVQDRDKGECAKSNARRFFNKDGKAL